MSVRLVFAIISTLLEEAALVVVALWGLPQIGIEIPLPGLIVLMVLWGGFSVFIYRMGSRALRRKPVVGLPVTVGTRGKAVRRLAPDGIARIKGELWEAESAHGNIEAGEEVIVIGHDGLKLIVKQKSAGDRNKTE